MLAPRPQLCRAPAERLAAWLVTGPAGHLWSTLADVAAFWARQGLAHLTGRNPHR